MRSLQDASVPFAARREAAKQILALDLRDESEFWRDPSPSPPPNPLLKKFANPSVAEAILLAMDAELIAFDARAPDAGKPDEFARDRIELEYVKALRELNDPRVAAGISERAVRAPSLLSRVRFAALAEDLGESQPLIDLANDLRGQRLTISSGKAGPLELEGVVWALENSDAREGELAMAAILDPKHPFHSLVAARVRQNRLADDFSFTSEGLPDAQFEFADFKKMGHSQCWFAHPGCLPILRQELDNEKATIVKITIEGNTVYQRACNAKGCRFTMRSIPSLLSDPGERRSKVVQRRCDVAAERLSTLVLGLPEYHPLRKDADERLAVYRSFMDQFKGKFRRLTTEERIRFGNSPRPQFIPEIPALTRGATAEDVANGLAIFHLVGKGRPVDLNLPLLAKRRDGLQPLIVLQAERTPNGELIYGAISQSEILQLPADAVAPYGE